MNTLLKNVDLLRPRGFAAVAIAVLALAVSGAGAYRLVSTSDELPKNVAFSYGGHFVTIDQLDQRVHTLSALYSIKVPTGGPRLSQFRRDAAKSMAVSMILEHEAQQKGVHVSQRQAEQGLESVIKNQLGGNEATFTSFLGDNGVSKRDVLDEITRTLESSDLYKQVTSKVPAPTDAAVRADYGKHSAQMRSPERRTIRNIVVASQRAAKTVIAKLRAGQPFSAVAASDSLDRATSKRGGLLGSVAKQDLDGGYAKVAFSARPGQVFGPVKSSSGWNVGIVDKITPSHPLTFADVKKTLTQALWSDSKLKVWNAWLAETIKAAHVRYADAYRPAHPDAAPSVAPAGGN